ncbi:MAG: DedA family protein [Sphingomicrobium sp.]|nr:DedA family protein [Sphingomonadales bacterium]
MSDWVIRLIEQAGYLGVGFLMFLETVFPPIPSEVIMPIAGAAAAKGKMSLGGVIASGTAGAMLGNIFWYLAARALGIVRLKPFILRWGRWLTIEWEEIVRAEHLFGRRGWLIVGVGRLLPTIRSIISVPAGLLRMRFLTFAIASTVGTALWTALLAGAGFKLGEHFSAIDRWLGPLSNIVILALIALYAWRVLRRSPRGQPG